MIKVIKPFDISNYISQIPLPGSVTDRWQHSLTAVTMSPHCVWLVIIGGSKEIRLRAEQLEGGHEEISWKARGYDGTFITDTNRLIMIIELGKIKDNLLLIKQSL